MLNKKLDQNYSVSEDIIFNECTGYRTAYKVVHTSQMTVLSQSPSSYPIKSIYHRCCCRRNVLSRIDSVHYVSAARVGVSCSDCPNRWYWPEMGKVMVVMSFHPALAMDKKVQTLLSSLLIVYSLQLVTPVE